MDAHQPHKNTNPPGEWLRRAPGVNGSKRAKKKKTGAVGAGKNWGPLKSENDLEGVNFFFEIDPDPRDPLRVREGGPLRVREGGPLRVREGGPERSRKKPMGFLGYRRNAVESFGRGVPYAFGRGVPYA